MLRKESLRNFIVYPSWAEAPAKWADLPRLMADPLNSGLLRRDFDPRRFGYPEEPQRYTLINGPVGNGIILFYNDPRVTRKWLAGCVLTECNTPPPSGMLTFFADQDPPEPAVCYIEPMGEAGWWLGLAKKPVIISVPMSYNHVDAAGEGVFWLIRYQRARRGQELKHLTDVPQWAGHFGLEVTRLKAPPEAVRAETEAWFPNPDRDSVWFQVSGQDDGIGYHFAVMIYVGQHLRWVAGPRLKAMHLLAQIEGRPQICSRWGGKN